MYIGHRSKAYYRGRLLRIAELRYVDGLVLQKIAWKVGLSTERVRQILGRLALWGPDGGSRYTFAERMAIVDRHSGRIRRGA